MSGIPDEVMTARKRVAGDEEPLFTENVDVQDNGNSSLRQTIPNKAVDLMDVEKGDTIVVEIYRDGWFVKPKQEV